MLRGVAEVPFADDRRAITQRLEHFSDRELGLRQTVQVVDEYHLMRESAADRVAAGQQTRAAGRAVRGAGVEIRQPHALARHGVEVRCFDQCRSVKHPDRRSPDRQPGR